MQSRDPRLEEDEQASAGAGGYMGWMGSPHNSLETTGETHPQPCCLPGSS